MLYIYSFLVYCCLDSPLKKCSRCQVTSYCSIECQRSSWTSHKQNCIPINISNAVQQANVATVAAAAFDSTSSSSSATPSLPVPPSLPAGFTVRPTKGQFQNSESDPEMIDLQRQLLSKVLMDQMKQAGGEEAMKRDPETFKRILQQKVAQQMVAAGMDPAALAAAAQKVNSKKDAAGGGGASSNSNAGANASSNASAGAGSKQHYFKGGGAMPKNPFTGETMSQTLGKNEMPFGMPGTFYGPDDDDNNDAGDGHPHDCGHDHGHDGAHNDHGHSHGDGDHGHSHGGGDGEHGHNHNHNHSHDGGEGGQGHNHSHGGEGHNHSHGGEGHNHSHGDHQHGGHNHSHGDGTDGVEEHAHGGDDADPAAHNHSHNGHNHNHNHGGEGHNHSHGDGHNHSHGGEGGHNHSHGDANAENGEHDHGTAGHNHNHNHNHGAGDDHGHSHGNGDHGHSHDGAGAGGNAGRHNHSHGAGNNHGHNHGGRGGGGDGHNHSHGDGDGHNHSHGGNDDGHDGTDVGHAKFGNKHAGKGSNQGPPGSSGPSSTPTPVSRGKVVNEDSPAAAGAQLYTQPQLIALDDGVADGLKELAGVVTIGPTSVDTKAAQAYQLVYASVSSKRPVALASSSSNVPPASLTFLPLDSDPNLDLSDRDLSERTGNCHHCILAKQPFPMKQPTQEDIATKQALYQKHVRIAENLEKEFEEKEIKPQNAPIAGVPAEVSQESLFPDCSIEIHSFQTNLKYINPLDKQYSQLHAAAAVAIATSTSAAAASSPASSSSSSSPSLSSPSSTPSPSNIPPFDAQRIQSLQGIFGLGPSKSALKKAKAKQAAKAKAAAAASNSSSSGGGGFLSSITSMFTGGGTASSSTAADKDEDEDDDDEDGGDEEAAPLISNTTGTEEESKDATSTSSSSSGNKEKKKSKSKKRATGGASNGAFGSASSLPSDRALTVVQVLVRCAPPTTAEQSFELALSDKDPLKMYRFEFISLTPSQPPPTPASVLGIAVNGDFNSSLPIPAPPPLLPAYQSALDFVLSFLARTHPVPEPSANVRAAYTVKDSNGVLHPAPYPKRFFPSHLSLWIDRSEWTGVPKTPFVEAKIPGLTPMVDKEKEQEKENEQKNENEKENENTSADPSSTSLISTNHPSLRLQINPNLIFTPKPQYNYQQSLVCALQEKKNSTNLLACIYKSYNLKELNLNIFPQGHQSYLYKSWFHINSERAARAEYFKHNKFRPKQLFQNERLDIQLQFEPTAEEEAELLQARERRNQGLPAFEPKLTQSTPIIELEEEAIKRDEKNQIMNSELNIPIQRFLIM